MSAFLRVYGDLVLAVFVIAFAALLPDLDLRLVTPFYRPGIGFPAGHIWWVRIIYLGVARFWVFALVFGTLIAAGYTRWFRARWRQRRKALVYLLVALVVGPGLIVNTVLKDHWGRPRPVHLAQFGGTAVFTPALSPSAQCERNCSFPSGHAGAAFFPMALYWVTRQRRWLVFGIGFGLVVGLTRMAMGAHFLSDVLFSGLVVHFTCRGLAILFQLPVPVSASARGPTPDAAVKCDDIGIVPKRDLTLRHEAQREH